MEPLITDAERIQADLTVSALVKAGRNAKPDYKSWCFCGWCILTRDYTPHWRRPGICPDPSEYVGGQIKGGNDAETRFHI